MDKVIFVTNFLGNGGAARVMSILADNLIYKNKNIEIISFLDRNDTYELKNDIKLTVLSVKVKIKYFKNLKEY